jgi:hypothetical protein
LKPPTSLPPNNQSEPSTGETPESPEKLGVKLWKKMSETTDRHQIEAVEESLRRNGPLPRKPPYVPRPRKLP